MLLHFFELLHYATILVKRFEGFRGMSGAKPLVGILRIYNNFLMFGLGRVLSE